MCGIAGIVSGRAGQPVDAAALDRITDALVHRGPDGRGTWTAAGVGLGHRRLAIIDVAGSPQPMTAGPLTIVFNGEIYNFGALRSELTERGHRFRTAGDTEVLLAAWAEWGTGACDRLDGMFAFAIHDERDGSVTLVRDRFGVKPLIAAHLPDGTLIFGSELKALLANRGLRARVEPRALEAYFALGYVPDQLGFLAGTRKLGAGEWVRLAPGDTGWRPHRWFRPAPVAASGRDGDEELLALIDRAVGSRMVADVPLGAFLSGGVDSSAVVASMAAASSRPVTTVAIGFDEADADESRFAALVAERYGTDHHRHVVAADSWGRVDALAHAFDEPFADASALSGLSLAREARRHVTVALSGDGADEAFAGYRRHVFFAAEARARALLPLAVRRPVFGALGAVWPKADWAPRPLRAKSTLQALGRPDWLAYALAVGVIAPDERRRLFSPALTRSLGGWRAEELYRAAWNDAPADDPLTKAQLADMALWLPGDICQKVDRTTMAASLEAREPLLDHRLVGFALGLPPGERVRGGTGKAALKQALEARLPREILYRPKMGFVTPVSAWFRGALAGEAAALADGPLAQTGWFSPGRIAEVAAEHRAGRRERGRLLWQLVMLERSLGVLGVIG